MFLQLKGLKKIYEEEKGLKNLDLEIEEGSFVTLLGPSGCGKTTTLNLLGGFIQPDSGHILLEGEDITGLPPERRPVSTVFQSYALFPHLNVLDNVCYGLRFFRGMKKKEAAPIAMEELKTVGLSGYETARIGELSGGQQQRVAIARALITKPAIVLLDEPLCNLDIQLRIEMRTEMAQLFHSLKTTVFHVTHDPSEAFAMADRIIVMNNGMIDQMDTPFACYLQPGTSMVAGLLGAGNCLMKALITSGSDEFCQVSLGGKKLTGLYFKPTGKAGTEDGTQVPFRAELRFRPEECGWQETEGENTIPVTVVMSTFEGGVYRIKVMTAEGEGFCLLHQDFLEEGKTGYACIAKERLYIYEKN